MALYSKFCIMCQTEFRTMKINSIYCSKRCGNRARSLPAKLKESLIKRSYKFTMLDANDDRPKHIIESDQAILMYEARKIARERGIDNNKYIYAEDPANGDATGFGIKSPDIQEEKHDNSNDSNSNGTDILIPVSVNSTNGKDRPATIGGGIRKIGGLR